MRQAVADEGDETGQDGETGAEDDGGDFCDPSCGRELSVDGGR